MPTIAAVGQSFALDAREACIQAIEQARQKILHEADNIVMALVFASRDYNFQGILSGASAQLRNTPLFGFSSEGQLTTNGLHQRSVVVALLAGSDVSVRANWWPDFSHDSQAKVLEMMEFLNLGKPEDAAPGILLINSDGYQGENGMLMKTLTVKPHTLMGGLTGGNDRQKLAFQIGGLSGGERGLGAAFIQGDVKAAIGAAHGWKPIGKYFQVSRAEDLWIRQLDHKPASESYAALFGQQAREWAFPPLNQLIRLYPLGLENAGNEYQVRSPLFVEVDGSLRMNARVKEGTIGHLLVGSSASCIEAAQEAARQALTSLGTARPILAVIFADIAWKMLLETQPGSEIAPIREVIGPAIPIIGGYTVGQIRSSPAGIELLNQHLEIMLIGAID